MSFNEEYKEFKAKSDDFLLQMGFREQVEAHKEMFEEMLSVSEDDMQEMIAHNPKFLTLRNNCIRSMEQIIEMQEDVLKVFDMPKEQFAARFKKNIKKADKYVSDNLKKIAEATDYFHQQSEEGRMIVENANNPSPFFSQNGQPNFSM